jgi:hypothetical protein
MRRIAILVALTVVAVVGTSKPAQACPDADWIPDWVVYPIAAGMVGGYAYGTGYFLQQDLTTDRRDRDYVVGDLAFNGVMGTIFGMATVDAISSGKPGTAVPLAAVTLLHTGLVVHAAMRVEVGDLHFGSTAAVWGIGSVYAIETLGFVANTDGHHGRAYGVVEASVQAPIAAGFGYLAYNQMQHDNPGTALLFGGMAAVSGALAVHGVKTAIAPYVEPKFDFLGTDVMPTVVDDGHDMGPGLAASRTW